MPEGFKPYTDNVSTNPEDMAAEIQDLLTRVDTLEEQVADYTKRARHFKSPALETFQSITIAVIVCGMFVLMTWIIFG
jgi:cell division septum initiation protein DivIVA